MAQYRTKPLNFIPFSEWKLLQRFGTYKKGLNLPLHLNKKTSTASPTLNSPPEMSLNSSRSASSSGQKSKRSFNSNNSSSSKSKKTKSTNQKTLGVSWGANSLSSSRSSFQRSPFPDFGRYIILRFIILNF